MRNEKLKEKMQQASYPFDPQAWRDMERLLDADKRKRRAAIWWWSTAALLLISAGVGAWMWMQQGTLSQQLAERTISMDGRESGVHPQDAPNAVSAARNEVAALEYAAEQESNSTNTQPLTTSEGGNSTTTFAKTPGSVRSKNHFGTSSNMKVNAGKLTLNNLSTSSAKNEPVAMVETPEMVASPISEKNLAVLMNLLSASLEQSPEIQLTDKLNSSDEKESFTKPVKKKFSFELGAIGRSTASFAGKTLAPLPSYEGGLQFGFCFGKHFAINTGLLAGQTNFRVQPATNSDSSANIVRFDSRINELNIPLGITITPFSNEQFNFHIGLGLSNHIKLQEKFVVVYKPIAPTPPSNITDAQVVVEEHFENNFANVDPVVETNQLPPSGKTAAVAVGDIALGSPERYYASGFATMGFDLRLVKQLWFSIDGFASLNPKIGVQQIHQWNVGGSLGIKYRFR